MVDFLTLTANSNVSRLDIFDFSDFFDFQADVPPESTTYAIQDLDCGLPLVRARQTHRFKSVGPLESEASCWVNFETRLANEAVTSSSDAAADEELVAAAKNGDELGFESLAKRHQRRIFALAFRYTRVREDAEDVVQETFRKAFVHLQKFEGKSSFSTWLTRIAINEALMSLRRRRALHEVPADDSSGDNGTTPGLDLADASPDPEATYLQKEEARIVVCGDKAPEAGNAKSRRVAGTGRFINPGDSPADGLSVAAIKGRVFHARKS